MCIVYPIGAKLATITFKDCLAYTVPENPIYLFTEMKLYSLVPNSNIHVSVRGLYIPRMGLPIGCSKIGRRILGIYKSLTDK
jgi:hypothetical protein